MKKLTKVWAVWTSLEALILAIVGIFIIVFRENSGFQAVIGIILSMFIILDGSLRIVSQFLDTEKSFSTLASGVVQVALGVFIVVESGNLEILEYISKYIAYVLFTVSTIFIVDASIRLARKSGKTVLSVFEYIGSGFLIAAGVLVIIFIGNVEFQSYILIGIGALLIIGAILEFGLVIKTIAAASKERRELEKKEKAEEKERAKKEKEAVPATPDTPKEETKQIDHKDVIEIEAKDIDEKDKH